MNERDRNTRRDGEEPTAPLRLVAALKELPPRRVFVPPAFDEAVLSEARRKLAPGGRRSRWNWTSVLRSWRLPFAAAGALGVAILLSTLFREAPQPVQFAREDINRDARVDILDAFQVAREMASGAGSHDVNGDGTVDQVDVDYIAQLSVRLPDGGRL